MRMFVLFFFARLPAFCKPAIFGATVLRGQLFEHGIQFLVSVLLFRQCGMKQFLDFAVMEVPGNRTERHIAGHLIVLNPARRADNNQVSKCTFWMFRYSLLAFRNQAFHALAGFPGRLVAHPLRIALPLRSSGRLRRRILFRILVEHLLAARRTEEILGPLIFTGSRGFLFIHFHAAYRTFRHEHLHLKLQQLPRQSGRQKPLYDDEQLG